MQTLPARIPGLRPVQTDLTEDVTVHRVRVFGFGHRFGSCSMSPPMIARRNGEHTAEAVTCPTLDRQRLTVSA
jgi:hypothetical protein